MTKPSHLEARFELLLNASGIEPWQTEYKFHSLRNWRFDFAWPEKKIAVECEGGVWSKGRHVRGQGFIDDCEKYNEAAYLGWTVLRFPAKMINDGRAIQLLGSCLVLKKNAFLAVCEGQR